MTMPTEQAQAELRDFIDHMEKRAAEERRFYLEQKYQAIADFRDEHGLSLAELAKVLGVSRPRAHQLVTEARDTERR